MRSSSAMILPMSFSTKDEYTLCSAGIAIEFDNKFGNFGIKMEPLIFGQGKSEGKDLSCIEKDSERYFPQTSDGFRYLAHRISAIPSSMMACRRSER